jgi:hypothetical protein
MSCEQPVRVFGEAGRRRVFASALEWPGWARSGKTEELALAALGDYLARYCEVVRRAALDVPAGGLEVTERLGGVAKFADFGALSAAAHSEAKPITPDEGHRFAALLAAAWEELDEAVAAAPAVLPKGSRGGGRDRDQILDHVTETELMHAGKLGLTPPRPRPAGDAAVAWLRAAMGDALRAGIGGEPGPASGWAARYVVRRSGWHLLDHAWELQDKSA